MKAKKKLTREQYHRQIDLSSKLLFDRVLCPCYREFVVDSLIDLERDYLRRFGVYYYSPYLLGGRAHEFILREGASS
jgi:hypothetical protein